MTTRTATRGRGTASADDLREIARRTTTISVPEAGRFFGVGEGLSYDLYRRGEFPVAVLPLGKKLRVRVSDVARALGIDLGMGAARDSGLDLGPSAA